MRRGDGCRARRRARDPGEITTIVVTSSIPLARARTRRARRNGCRWRTDSRMRPQGGRAARSRAHLALHRAAAEQQGARGARVRDRRPLGRPRFARGGGRGDGLANRRLHPTESDRRPGPRGGRAGRTRAELAERVLGRQHPPRVELMAVAPLGEELREQRSSGSARHPSGCDGLRPMPPRCRWECPGTSEMRFSRARHTCASGPQ